MNKFSIYREVDEGAEEMKREFKAKV